jgi:hypothetical protein
MGNQQRKGGSSRPKNRASRAHDPKPGPAVKGAAKQAAETPPATRAGRADAIKSSREAARQRYEKNQRELRMIRIGGAVLVLALLGLIGYGIVRWANDRTDNAEPEKTVANFAYPGGQHVEGTVAYTENPPVGGEHNSRWQNCGFYDKEVYSENAVHSLEHGAVWITYSPDLPQDQIDKLKKTAEGQDYVLVSPFPGLPSPVVASTWNHQIQLDGANDPDLNRFIRNYKQGADTPEPGASCSGNVSTTK